MIHLPRKLCIIHSFIHSGERNCFNNNSSKHNRTPTLTCTDIDDSSLWMMLNRARITPKSFLGKMWKSRDVTQWGRCQLLYVWEAPPLIPHFHYYLFICPHFDIFRRRHLLSLHRTVNGMQRYDPAPIEKVTTRRHWQPSFRIDFVQMNICV